MKNNQTCDTHEYAQFHARISRIEQKDQQQLPKKEEEQMRTIFLCVLFIVRNRNSGGSTTPTYIFLYILCTYI